MRTPLASDVMKIALISEMFPPDVGGAETYAFEIAQALGERGHDVDVYTTTSEEGNVETHENVEVRHLFRRRKLPIVETVLLSLKARRLIDFADYDVVHGTLMPATTIALTPGLGMEDVPLIVTSHGTSLSEFKSHNPSVLADYLLKYIGHPGNFVLDFLAGQSADEIIAISDHVEEELKESYHFGKKVSMIPHGVDTERFSPCDKVHSACTDEKFTIVTVGRLGPRKGIGLAIRGISELDDPNIELLIGGTGRHEDRLREIAKKEDVIEQVKFLGYVPDEELPLLYSSADVFSLTSRYEGLGLVLLEAMACGTPVVATDVGGVSTIVEDGQNGFLTQRNAKEFSKCLKKIMSGQKMEVLSRNFALEKDWSSICEDVEEIYNNNVK